MGKRRFFCFAVAVLLGMLLGVLSVGAAESGETDTALPDAVGDAYEEWLASLPEEILSLLPEGMLSADEKGIAEGVEQTLTPSYCFQILSSAVGLYLGDAVRLLARVVGILLLSSVFSIFRRSFSSEGLGRVVSIVMSSVLLSELLFSQERILDALGTYFGRLSTLAGGMIPLTASLYAIGGNVTGAATSSTMLSAFLALSEWIGGKMLFPTVGICMSLAIVRVTAPSLRLSGLSSAVKKTFTFLIGFLMMMLSALLAMRSGIAAKADSISARTLKYLTSSVIPVVGGSIADSLRTVGSGVEYLRTTVGAAGIVAVVLLLLPCIVNLLLTRFSLIVSATIAEILGCETEEALLKELVSVYGYILAVSVMCAVMFIFALMILIRTASAVGG